MTTLRVHNLYRSERTEGWVIDPDYDMHENCSFEQYLAGLRATGCVFLPDPHDIVGYVEGTDNGTLIAYIGKRSTVFQLVRSSDA
jgi:hypothetical protein